MNNFENKKGEALKTSPFLFEIINSV